MSDNYNHAKQHLRPSVAAGDVCNGAGVCNQIILVEDFHLKIRNNTFTESPNLRRQQSPPPPPSSPLPLPPPLHVFSLWTRICQFSKTLLCVFRWLEFGSSGIADERLCCQWVKKKCGELVSPTNSSGIREVCLSDLITFHTCSSKYFFARKLSVASTGTTIFLISELNY